MNTATFTHHSQVVQPSGIITPRFVTEQIQRPSLHTLSDAERNRILDDLIEREKAQRQHALDAQAELHSEGHVHRNTRPQRHD